MLMLIVHKWTNRRHSLRRRMNHSHINSIRFQHNGDMRWKLTNIATTSIVRNNHSCDWNTFLGSISSNFKPKELNKKSTDTQPKQIARVVFHHMTTFMAVSTGNMTIMGIYLVGYIYHSFQIHLISILFKWKCLSVSSPELTWFQWFPDRWVNGGFIP